MIKNCIWKISLAPSHSSNHQNHQYVIFKQVLFGPTEICLYGYRDILKSLDNMIC